MFKFALVIILLILQIFIQKGFAITTGEVLFVDVNFDAKSSYIEKQFRNTLPSRKSITYTTVPRGLILSIDANEFFNSQETEITENGKCILRAIGKILSEFNNNCTIESHSEEVLDGSHLYKEAWEMTIIRANKIAEFICQNSTLDCSRIMPIGFGEMMPFNENVSEIEFSNNRIDFVIFDYTVRR